jgi:predicted transcriptional regulator
MRFANDATDCLRNFLLRNVGTIAGLAVSRSCVRSSANFANFRLYEPAGSRELEAKLARLAAESGRAAHQLGPDVLASSVDHDECFRAEVEKGRAAAREGRLIEHDNVATRRDRRFAADAGPLTTDAAGDLERISDYFALYALWSGQTGHRQTARDDG